MWRRIVEIRQPVYVSGRWVRNRRIERRREGGGE